MTAKFRQIWDRPSSHPVIGPYWRLMRLDKPVGSLLILWPTLASLWIAGEGNPDISLIIIFTLGTFVMRSAGCVINDFADRKVDAGVARTASRPLATGELSSRNAMVCFAVLGILAFGLVLLTDKRTILLSLVGLALAMIYPFLKRLTNLPQIWLGFAMNWGLVMAYSAQADTLSPGLWILYAATICWTVTYDTFYAMVDREDDLRMGIKSIAILFGDLDRHMTAFLQMLTLAALFIASQRFGLGAPFLNFAVAGSALLFGYQQYLIRHREPAACFAAFMNNRWVALLLFVGVITDFIF